MPAAINTSRPLIRSVNTEAKAAKRCPTDRPDTRRSTTSPPTDRRQHQIKNMPMKEKRVSGPGSAASAKDGVIFQRSALDDLGQDEPSAAASSIPSAKSTKPPCTGSIRCGKSTSQQRDGSPSAKALFSKDQLSCGVRNPFDKKQAKVLTRPWSTKGERAGLGRGDYRVVSVNNSPGGTCLSSIPPDLRPPPQTGFRRPKLDARWLPDASP